MKNYGTLENLEIEKRISVLAGEEEAQRVRGAIFEALRRDEMKSTRFEQEIRETERKRCIEICARFPDNLMARHIAELIRSGK